MRLKKRFERKARGLEPAQKIESSKADQPSILIIANSIEPLRSTEAFLNKREMPTQIVSNMNDALSIVSKGEVSVVLLSMNIPHPKVEVIPNLLNSTFGVDVIVFAELVDRKIQQKLAGAKIRNILYGHASGPAVQMRIKQMQKEKEILKKSGQLTVRSSTEGSNQSSNDTSIHLSGGNKNREEAVAQFMQSLKNADQNNQISSSSASASQIHQINSRSNAHQDQSLTNGKTAAQLGTMVDKGQGPTKGSAVQDGQRSDLKSSTSGGGADGNPFTHSPEQRNSTKNKAKEFHAKPPKLHRGSTSNPGTDGEDFSTQESQKTTEGSATDGHQVRERNWSNQGALEETDDFKNDLMSLWVCAEAALRDVLSESANSCVRLKDMKAVGIFMVRSHLLRGCFIIAANQEKITNDDVICQIKDRLLFHLERVGIDMTSASHVLVEADSQHFSEGCLEYAEFMTIANNQDAEIAIAFISKHDLLPPMEWFTTDMLRIELQHFTPELAVRFEAFLHMPMNQKFLKYVPNGGHLLEKQQAKLDGHEVKHLMIHERHIEAFKQFHVKNAVHEAIEELKRKRETKPDSEES